MTKKARNNYNHYTEAFRREAVRQSEGSDTSAAEVRRRCNSASQAGEVRIDRIALQQIFDSENVPLAEGKPIWLL